MSDPPKARPPADPFDDWRKRMKDDPFLGPFFTDIDREFERMRESLGHMLQGMSEGMPQSGKDPYVYGFSLRLGPDGKPQFQEFGNVKPLRPGRLPLGLKEAREPLVDVQASDNVISVTVELPGVDKKDINVRALERELTIKVDAAGRKYYKRIDLPASVRPQGTRATYKNGVLDVELEKLGGGGPDVGTKVDVA